MSHFSVAVISNDSGNGVEDLLAPYDENMEVAPYIDMTKKNLIEEYNKNIDEAKNKPDSYARKMEDRDHILNMSQEKFSRYFHGEESAIFDKDGNLLTTHNPDTKWDWWTEGGRWKNLLKMKRVYGGERCNSASLLKVDWDFLNRITKKHEKYLRRFWEIHVLGQKMTKAEEKSHDYFSMFNKEYYLKFYGSLEDYIKMTETFHTYAVVTPDGMWYGLADMGYWGMDNSKPDTSREWKENWFENFIKPFMQLKENHYITIIDCHI